MSRRGETVHRWLLVEGLENVKTYAVRYGSELGGRTEGFQRDLKTISELVFKRCICLIHTDSLIGETLQNNLEVSSFDLESLCLHFCQELFLPLLVPAFCRKLVSHDTHWSKFTISKSIIFIFNLLEQYLFET